MCGLAPPPRFVLDQSKLNLLVDYAGSSVERWELLAGQRLRYLGYGNALINTVEYDKDFRRIYLHVCYDSWKCKILTKDILSNRCIISISVSLIMREEIYNFHNMPLKVLSVEEEMDAGKYVFDDFNNKYSLVMNYLSHCWMCGAPIDSSVQVRCQHCKRYYHCSKCGICKCGQYHENR